MPKSEKQKLTLRIDGARVTKDNFEDAVRSFFRLIADVSHSVSGHKEGIEWIVAVKEGSNLVEAMPEAREDVSFDRVDEAVYSVLQGIEELEAGIEQQPKHFSDKSLKASKRLAKVRGNGIDEIVLQSNGTAFSLRSTLIDTVKSILEAKYSSVGSIEGTLESISLRGSPTFNIYRPPSDQKVECSFPKEMLEVVRSALNKRVSVWGSIKYRRDGTPIRVRTREIRTLGDKENLPGMDDVLGILSSPTHE